MARYISWTLAGDVSCFDSVLKSEHVSEAVLEKIRSVVLNQGLTELPNKKSLKPNQWKSSDNECSRKLEKSLLDPRANLVFMPKELLANLNKTKVFIQSCEVDVLRDDSFVFAQLLRSHNVAVEHIHLPNCYHEAINYNDNAGKTLKNAINGKVNSALS